MLIWVFLAFVALFIMAIIICPDPSYKRKTHDVDTAELIKALKGRK